MSLSLALLDPSDLLGATNDNYQLLRFARSADTRWEISPEASDALQRELRDPNERVILQLQVVFERALSIQGSRTTSLTKVSVLTTEQRLQLLAVPSLLANLSFVNGMANPVELVVHGMFPKFVRLPSVADAQASELTGSSYRWHSMQSLRVFLVTGGVETSISSSSSDGKASRWWVMEQAARDASPFNTSALDGLQVVIAAERLAGGSAAISLTAGGVVAFYVLVVFGIGRVVRTILRDTRYRIVVDEMPDTRDLVDLIEGVYMARHEGELVYETELHETIIRMYRSPVSLLQLTGDRLR